MTIDTITRCLQTALAQKPGQGLVFALDVSGSTAGFYLDMLAIIRTLRARTTVPFTLMTFDMNVIQILHLGSDPIPNVLPPLEAGRGGTDFTPVLRRADQENPAAIVVFTDLLGPVPKPVKAPVLWIIEEEHPHFPAPFGTVLSLKA